jgi:hypothetical protein
LFRQKYPERWPKPSGDAFEEYTLYHFCYQNKKKFQNNRLEIFKIKLLNDINFNFHKDNSIQISEEWYTKYEKLLLFRQKYPERWPKPYRDDLERALYQFCYRNKMRFLNGNLEEGKINLLKDIDFNFDE